MLTQTGRSRGHAEGKWVHSSSSGGTKGKEGKTLTHFQKRNGPRTVQNLPVQRPFSFRAKPWPHCSTVGLVSHSYFNLIAIKQKGLEFRTRRIGATNQYAIMPMSNDDKAVSSLGMINNKSGVQGHHHPTSFHFFNEHVLEKSATMYLYLGSRSDFHISGILDLQH